MKKRIFLILLFLALITFLVFYIYNAYLRPGIPAYFSDEVEHFKYGSIGAEVNGYPYDVWLVLPDIFKQEIPRGYKTFGFIKEKGQVLPVGLSVRKYDVKRVGFNCATCHTAQLKGQEELLLGAPAFSLDLQSYLNFLSAASRSPKFNPDTLLAAMNKKGIRKNFIDKLIYKYYLLPKIKEVFTNRAETHAWEGTLPTHGPGRTDAINPWKYNFGILEEKNNLVPATVSFPSVWNQRDRQKAWMHWDGNNKSVHERNLSAALAGGATEESLDMASIKRIAQWLHHLKAPAYPYPLDSNLVKEGKIIYNKAKCGNCHAVNGEFFGESTAIGKIQTDSSRWYSFNEKVLKKFSTVGEGYSWQFKHYRKSAGYANMPLDGIWARTPYLHNNSVPTLMALLTKPANRPTTFYIGCNAYDAQNGGLVCKDGFMFDTRIRGNSNSGHSYGTELTIKEKKALVEFLKTI